MSVNNQLPPMGSAAWLNMDDRDVVRASELPATAGSDDPRVVKHGWKPNSETERCFSCKHNALCKSEVSYFMEDYWCAAYQPNDDYQTPVG